MERRAPPPAEYLRQAEDLVARLDADLALLPTLPAATNTAPSSRRRLFERLFRHTHTLKGTAATFGDDVTARIAHEIEDALHALRTHPRVAGQVAAQPHEAELENALHEAVDAVAVHLSSAESGETHRDEIARATTRAIERLQTCARLLSATGGGSASKELPDSLPAFDVSVLPAEWGASRLESRTIEHLGEVARDNLNLFSLTLDFTLDTLDEAFRRCETLLSERGEIIETRPLPPRLAEPAEPSRLRFCFLYAAALEPDQLRGVLSDYAAEITLVRESERREERTDDFAADEREEIRVPLAALDELVYSIGELHDKTLALFAADEQSSPVASVSGARRAEPEALRRRFLGVQDKLLRLRMVPLEGRLREALRAGRVAARVRGKDVVWEVRGGDVLLDKALAERLSAPLVHLVRNAVDHGIEDAGERRQAGKDARGRISVRALADGGRVRVLVSDDGRGIEPERVREAAIRNGIIAPDHRLDETDNLRLIFRAGFTTANHGGDADLVSGRGVGLDAAERAVEEFGGELRLRSTPGRGTVFEMRLPTTLALLEAWVVGSGGVRYCIPAEHVLDAITFADSRFVNQRDDSAARFIRWRNSDVPLATLSSLLEDEPHDDANEVFDGMSSAEKHALVVNVGAQGATVECVALVVDEWEPGFEILARGLGAQARVWYGVTAAAELADGSLALLLDVRELIKGQQD